MSSYQKTWKNNSLRYSEICYQANNYVFILSWSDLVMILARTYYSVIYSIVSLFAIIRWGINVYLKLMSSLNSERIQKQICQFLRIFMLITWNSHSNTPRWCDLMDEWFDEVCSISTFSCQFTILWAIQICALTACLKCGRNIFLLLRGSKNSPVDL